MKATQTEYLIVVMEFIADIKKDWKAMDPHYRGSLIDYAIWEWDAAGDYGSENRLLSPYHYAQFEKRRDVFIYRDLLPTTPFYDPDGLCASWKDTVVQLSQKLMFNDEPQIVASIDLTEVDEPKEKKRAAKRPRPDDEPEECGDIVDLSAVLPVIDLSCAPITKQTKVTLS